MSRDPTSGPTKPPAVKVVVKTPACAVLALIICGKKSHPGMRLCRGGVVASGEHPACHAACVARQ